MTGCISKLGMLPVQLTGVCVTPFTVQLRVSEVNVFTALFITRTDTSSDPSVSLTMAVSSLILKSSPVIARDVMLKSIFNSRS